MLPGPFPIAARKTYGHVSDGMIASARELGLGDEHDGILGSPTWAWTPTSSRTPSHCFGLDDAAVQSTSPRTGWATR